MTTLENYKFGEVMTVEHTENYHGYSVHLNFQTGLGNNFLYSHFVDSILENMTPDNAQELFIEWTRGLDLNDDLIIYDSEGVELNTCVSDFNDHTRAYWKNYCERVYG